MKLQVRELVGTICITREAGEKVFDKILPELNNRQPVTMDFSGVNIFASPFFSTAIGRLFRLFDRSELDQLLSFENLNASGRKVLNVVMDNSEKYYRDPSVKKAVDRVFEKWEEEDF